MTGTSSRRSGYSSLEWWGRHSFPGQLCQSLTTLTVKIFTLISAQTSPLQFEAIVLVLSLHPSSQIPLNLSWSPFRLGGFSGAFSSPGEHFHLSQPGSRGCQMDLYHIIILYWFHSMFSQEREKTLHIRNKHGIKEKFAQILKYFILSLTTPYL